MTPNLPGGQMSKKQYDYLDEAWQAANNTPKLKHVLRKLVREAVRNAQATTDETVDDAGKRIAKRMVP